MAKPKEVERLLKIIYKRHESADGPDDVHTSIVTNGSLITNAHIRMFKRYKTRLAVSCDGPAELNLLRGPEPDDPEVTLKHNELLAATLRRLRDEDLSVSIMCVLHTANAGDQGKLDHLMAWLRSMHDIGITGGRLNQLYAPPWLEGYELTPEQLTNAYTQLADFTIDTRSRWNPFRELIDNLVGVNCTPCIFNQCDPFQTNTLAILPDGTLTNCDRTFADGLHTRSTSPESSARYEVLKQDECFGCEFWSICGGGCPTEGSPDWRYKTRFCESIYATYKHIENRLLNLLPNLILVNHRLHSRYQDAFLPMSRSLCSRASTYGNYVLKDTTNNMLRQSDELPDGLPTHLDPSKPWREVPGGWYADSDHANNPKER